MPALHWKTFRQVELTRTYRVLLCKFPLKSYRAIPRFLRLALQVQRQLGGARGLVAYSHRARPLLKEFWILSVWESEKTLMNFVRRAPHYTVMNALQSEVGPTQFFGWTIPGTACPPMWDEALARATFRPRGETWPQPKWPPLADPIPSPPQPRPR
jgi:hypothetical protein